MAQEKIYLYHTNDLHSAFRFWPRINAELLKRRAQHEQAAEEVFVFDIGDAADRVHPLVEATSGQALTRLFNDAHYDAVTIGNNEGTTYSKDALNELYEEADFSVLLANLIDAETGKAPAWADPYQVITTKTGSRIGIFGLTNPIYDAYENLGWTAIDPIQATEQMMEEHLDKADFWILLSHLGLPMDRQLAEHFPLDLILGAHTHHALPTGEKVGETWLAGAGNIGRYVGAIELGYQENKLVVEDIRLLDTTTDLPAVAGEDEQVAAYAEKGHALLVAEPLTVSTKAYGKALYKNSPLMKLILEAIMDFSETEVAFLNAGLLMEDLEAGVVTADDLHRMLPHPIRVMKCEIKGEDLPRLMEELTKVNEWMQYKKPTGNGFRGKTFGKMCFQGMTLQDGEVYWLGQPVEANKTYTFATVNYLSFYSIFDILNTHTKQTVYFPELLREVVGKYLATVGC